MPLPYENATSGEKAIMDMQKILQRFGCQSFGQMMDYEKKELMVQFKYRDMPIQLKVSINGYAVTWLKEYPWSSRKKLNKIEYERLALEKAGVAVYSILRDWIKGQITAVECGIVSFEGAFLGNILLPTGETIMERVVKEELLQIGSK